MYVQNQIEITNLQVNYYTEKLRKENELLEREKEVYRLAIEKKNVIQSRLLIVSLVAIMVTFVALYSNWQKKHLNNILQKKIHESLKTQEEQIKFLNKIRTIMI